MAGICRRSDGAARILERDTEQCKGYYVSMAELVNLI
jgi:hypothetical protein